jgi:hypothetical protein
MIRSQKTAWIENTNSLQAQTNTTPKMAPSAVEVETVQVPDVSTLKLKPTLNSPYKELAATKFDSDAEAGLKGHKAAKVSAKEHHSLQTIH